LGRIDTRRLISLGLVEDDEAVEMFQDQGYTEVDAKRLLAMTKGLDEQKDFKKIVADTRNRILQAYEMGIMTRDDAAIQLTRLTITTSAGLDAFDSLPPLAQLQTSQVQPSINAALDLLDLQSKMKIAEEWIKTVHTQFQHGKIQWADVVNRLGPLGVTQDWFDSHQQLWIWEQQHQSKEEGAAKLLSWFEKGILLLPELVDRLTNMGYDQPTIAHMIAQAQLDLAQQQAKAALAAARTIQQQQKALAAKVKADQAAAAKAQAQLAKHGSPAQLVKWYSRHLIEAKAFVARLAALGWPPGDANALLGEAELARGEYDAKVAKSGKTPAIVAGQTSGIPGQPPGPPGTGGS
jgi:hypothetical protein